MLKFTILVIAAFFFSFCGRRNSSPDPNFTDSTVVDTMAVLNDPKSNLNVQTDRFTEIDTSGILMFPLSMGETEKSGRSVSYKEIPSNSYWNVVFYNSLSSEYHLLTERKILINNFETGYTSQDDASRSYNSKYIFYTVVTDDLNKDRKLTDADPNYLFISDRYGRNFRQLSPPGLNLRSWKYVKRSNRIIMLVARDSNKDRKFEEDDEVTSFEINADTDSIPREIFNEEFKKKLKLMYDRDWKRIEK